jgi:hypothetical protein
MCQSYGQKTVVIIDEYDKPLLSTIDLPEKHNELKNALRSFYGVLKSSDEYLRMGFLTGVAKFSQVSVFSDLNNLTDISLNHFFNHGDFEPYWFSTGTPTFLIKLMEKQKIDILNLEKCTFTLAAMQKFNVDNMEALAVLYQAGYLTITAYNEELNEYTLDCPNEEVRSAEEALEQIDHKEYLLPWKGSGKGLFKVGVSFDFEKRNIGGWKAADGV